MSSVHIVHPSQTLAIPLATALRNSRLIRQVIEEIQQPPEEASEIRVPAKLSVPGIRTLFEAVPKWENSFEVLLQTIEVAAFFDAPPEWFEKHDENVAPYIEALDARVDVYRALVPKTYRAMLERVVIAHRPYQEISVFFERETLLALEKDTLLSLAQGLVIQAVDRARTLTFPERPPATGYTVIPLRVPFKHRQTLAELPHVRVDLGLLHFETSTMWWLDEFFCGVHDAASRRLCLRGSVVNDVTGTSEAIRGRSNEDGPTNRPRLRDTAVRRNEPHTLTGELVILG